MIEYTAEYDEDTKPFLCKKITLPDEVIKTEITIHNKTELDNFTDEVIYQHLDNLVLYMKNDLSPSLEITAYQVSPTDPYPLIHWDHMTHLAEEIDSWFWYVYYRVEVVIDPEEAAQ
jgi:hypothetical protein